jgi:hypothetical protein
MEIDCGHDAMIIKPGELANRCRSVEICLDDVKTEGGPSFGISLGDA